MNLSFALFLSQASHLVFKFFNLVALEIDKFEHLKVLLLISAENS